MVTSTASRFTVLTTIERRMDVVIRFRFALVIAFACSVAWPLNKPLEIRVVRRCSFRTVFLMQETGLIVFIIHVITSVGRNLDLWPASSYYTFSTFVPVSPENATPCDEQHSHIKNRVVIETKGPIFCFSGPSHNADDDQRSLFMIQVSSTSTRTGALSVHTPFSFFQFFSNSSRPSDSNFRSLVVLNETLRNTLMTSSYHIIDVIRPPKTVSC